MAQKSNHGLRRGNQSLSFLIIVTVYFLLFFSWVVYFSSLEGQITKLVLRNDVEHQVNNSRILAKYGKTRLQEMHPRDTGSEAELIDDLKSIVKDLNRLKKNEKEAVIFVDSVGNVIAIPDEIAPKFQRVIENCQLKVFGKYSHYGLDGSQVMEASLTDSRYGKIILALTPLGVSDYRVGLLWDRGSLISDATRLEHALLGSLMLTFIVIIVLFMLLVRLIMSPLKILVTAAQRIGQGDLKTRVDINSNNEVGILAKAFNIMVEDLEAKYGESEQYLKRLKLMHDDAQRTLEIVAKRNRELAMINSLSLESGKRFSFNENLEYLINKLVQDFDMLFAESYTWDDRRKEWLLGISSRPVLWEYENDEVFNILLTKASRTGKVVITSGRNYFHQVDKEETPGELIIIPLVTGSDEHVLVLIASKDGDSFAGRDIVFFTNLLRHEGVILHNAQLYEASLKQSAILEKINSIGQTIISELDLEKLVPRVLRELKSLLTVGRVTIVYKNLCDENLIGYTIDEEWELKRFDRFMDDRWCTETLASYDYMLDQTGSSAPDWVWNLYGEDYRSFLGMRLTDREKDGLLALYAGETRFFTNEDVQFIKTFANYLTSAFANAKLFSEINEREQTRTEQLEVARKLQSDIIPYQYEQGRLEFECSLQPAMELAGDFFDVFSLGPKSVGVVIGDVATKGIAASLMTFSLLSMFRNAAKTLTPPNKVMALVNQGLMTQLKEKSWFATAFYARIHTDDLTMTYAKAGHVLPILFKHETGETIPLDVDGVPLGILEDGRFQTGQLKLEEKDRLVLYTDGVTEMKVDDMRLFGLDGLMKVVSENGRKPIRELKDEIFTALDKASNTKAKRDDVLVAVLGIKTDPWISRTCGYNDMQDLIADVMERMKQYDLPKHAFFAIRLSLNEALTNAYKHGNSGDPYKNIFVSYLVTDDSFSLKVRDEGQGFDYEALPDPTVEENLLLPHGRGIFLMRSFMDEVEFNDTGNTIQLTKYVNFKLRDLEQKSSDLDISLEPLAIK